jgi:hypothetical protein
LGVSREKAPAYAQLFGRLHGDSQGQIARDCRCRADFTPRAANNLLQNCDGLYKSGRLDQGLLPIWAASYRWCTGASEVARRTRRLRLARYRNVAKSQ